MNRALVLAFFLVFVAVSAKNYHCIKSGEVTTPSHSFGECPFFEDISVNCTTANDCKSLFGTTSYDDYAVELLLPFPVSFYGQRIDFVYVSSNGVVSTSNSLLFVSYWQNLNFDNANVLPGWYPFWDDLVMNGSSSVLAREFSDKYIIQWNDLFHYEDSQNSKFTFQIVWEKDSDNFHFAYEKIANNITPVRNGRTATIGVFKSTSKNLLYSYNTAGLSSDNVISFSQDGTDVTYNFNNIAVSANEIALGSSNFAEITFPFTFFENHHSFFDGKIWVNKNGVLLFSDPAARRSDDNFDDNKDLKTMDEDPNEDVTPGIYLFWDNLDTQIGKVYEKQTGTTPNRQYILQWTRTHQNLLYDYGYPRADSISAQVIFHEYTGEVELKYVDTTFGFSGFDHAENATIGFYTKTNSNSDSGYFLYSFNQHSVCDGDSIVFKCAEGY